MNMQILRAPTTVGGNSSLNNANWSVNQTREDGREVFKQSSCSLLLKFVPWQSRVYTKVSFTTLVQNNHFFVLLTTSDRLELRQADSNLITSLFFCRKYTAKYYTVLFILSFYFYLSDSGAYPAMDWDLAVAWISGTCLSQYLVFAPFQDLVFFKCQSSPRSRKQLQCLPLFMLFVE